MFYLHFKEKNEYNNSFLAILRCQQRFCWVIDLFLFFRVSALSRQHTTLKDNTEAIVLVPFSEKKGSPTDKSKTGNKKALLSDNV